MTKSKPSRQCTAKANSTGRRCRVPAVIGLTVCWKHGGANRRAQRKSTVAKELAAWGFTDQRDDPGDVLLKLVTLSSRRVAFYASLLEQQYEAAARHDVDVEVSLPRGIAALIGHKYGAAGKDGVIYQVEEAIRGLVALEGSERDRCARAAKAALDAGIAERQVRLAEQQGAMIVAAMRAMVEAAVQAGMPQQWAATVLEQGPTALRQLEAAPV